MRLVDTLKNIYQKKEINMQEYVKISTDKHTSDLLKQVSRSIEDAISEGIDNIEWMNPTSIVENLEVIIKKQNDYSDYLESFKKQLINIDTKVEKASEFNLSQVKDNNERNKNLVLAELVGASEFLQKQNKSLSEILLIQNAFNEKLSAFAEFSLQAISTLSTIREDLNTVMQSSEQSSQLISKLFAEIVDMRNHIVSDSNEARNTHNLILSNQNNVAERINNIEAIQNKPWYKKIFK